MNHARIARRGAAALLLAFRATAAQMPVADNRHGQFETRAELEEAARNAELQHRSSEAWLLRARLQRGDFQEGDRILVSIDVPGLRLGEMPTLASALYIPHSEEFPNGSFPLPWNDAGEPAIVGQFAREHGALVPDRLVTSAKSWLSNPHIDPKQRILPWRSDIAEEKLSPLECSRRYLAHLRDAFLHAERAQGRDWDLSEAQIVLTVPASFDDVARSLTAEAAKAAGLGDVTLLEEPQAAFYAWTAKAGRTHGRTCRLADRRHCPGARRLGDRDPQCRALPGLRRAGHRSLAGPLMADIPVPATGPASAGPPAPPASEGCRRGRRRGGGDPGPTADLTAPLDRSPHARRHHAA